MRAFVDPEGGCCEEVSEVQIVQLGEGVMGEVVIMRIFKNSENNRLSVEMSKNANLLELYSFLQIYAKVIHQRLFEINKKVFDANQEGAEYIG